MSPLNTNDGLSVYVLVIDARAYCKGDSERFLCTNREQCVPGAYLCDSVQQCWDGSDEDGCGEGLE